MSLTTLLFVVTVVVVFSCAEVLKVLVTELLQPAPVPAEEGLAAAPLLLLQVPQAADVPEGAAGSGSRPARPPRCASARGWARLTPPG